MGKFRINIFQDAGFDADILGKHRINCACRRWLIVEKHEIGLLKLNYKIKSMQYPKIWMSHAFSIQV
ncbi:hypothetical protein E4V42_21915 [Clostridium estertheticum]|uniref:Uncharacterized protein n=1 Tax=Clostridium estertheticum TaxID=238834 RepID=A0A5N7IUT1_9CLOT|nr:hypothetical protein [Clostridium estertheticum]MPQ34054.1 hypothetical protein [Clostridium estertheticum]MPQ64854.1 hypothetical protein [Clostridium estertheticum]